VPKATAQLYTDLQTVLDELVTLEAAARSQGDRELEQHAGAARRELANTRTVGTAALRRIQ